MWASNLYYITFRVLNMNNSTSERVALMLSELDLDQVEFGKLAGASKSVVNQWLSGLIQKVGPKYAYNLERNTGYRKEWIMFGSGEPKLTASAAAKDQVIADAPNAGPPEAVEAAGIFSAMNEKDRVEVLHWLRVEAIRRRHS